MVEQVTLQEPGVASAGNPNFLGSFSGSIRQAGNLGKAILATKEKAEPVGAIARLYGISLRLGADLGITGGSLKASKLELIAAAREEIGAGNISDSQVAQVQSILRSFGTKEGIAGQFVTKEITEQQVLEQEQAEQNANIRVNLLDLPKSATPQEVENQVNAAKSLIVDLEKHNLLLENMNARADVDVALKKETQMDMFTKNTHGNALAISGQVRLILGSLSPRSSQEEKDAALDAINSLEFDTVATLGRDYSLILTDVEAQSNNLSSLFTVARNSLSNEESARSIRAANSIASEFALSELIYNNPEALKLHTLLTTIGGYSDTFNFEEQSVFGIQINKLAKLLGFLPSDGNIADAFIPAIDQEEAAKSYAIMISDPSLVKSMKNNPKLAAKMAELGQLTTNTMKTDPSKVPAQVYDNFLTVLSTKGGLENLTSTPEGQEFANNISSGMRSYTSTLTDSLYRELTSEVNSRVPVVESLPTAKSTFSKITIPGTDIEVFRNSSPDLLPKRAEGSTSFPRVGDLINMTIGPKGNIEFSAKPGLQNNPEVDLTVRRLSKKYTNRFGMIIRTQAHHNNNNTDYNTAAHQIVTGERRLLDIFGIKKPVEVVIPKQENAIDPLATVKESIDQGNTEQAIEDLKKKGVDVSKLGISPDLTSATEGSIIQMNDGTIAIVKNGKLIEPTAEDLQLG